WCRAPPAHRGARPWGGRAGGQNVNRDSEPAIVRAGGFDCIVVRGEAKLLPIRREGVIVLPAKRKDWSIVIARSEIAGSHAWSRTLPVLRRGGCPHPPGRAMLDDSLPGIAGPGGRGVRPYVACATTIYRNHKQMRPLAFPVCIPMPIKQMRKNLRANF